MHRSWLAQVSECLLSDLFRRYTTDQVGLSLLITPQRSTLASISAARPSRACSRCKRTADRHQVDRTSTRPSIVYCTLPRCPLITPDMFSGKIQISFSSSLLTQSVPVPVPVPVIGLEHKPRPDWKMIVQHHDTPTCDTWKGALRTGKRRGEARRGLGRRIHIQAMVKEKGKCEESERGSLPLVLSSL